MKESAKVQSHTKQTCIKRELLSFIQPLEKTLHRPHKKMKT